MSKLRPIILSSWNCRFWFILATDYPVWSTEALDVHTGIEQFLSHIAITPAAHAFLTPLVGVSIESDSGPWCTFPIGPAFRQAPKPTRQVVRQLLEESYPAISREWLEQGDIESYEAWRESNRERLGAT